MAAPMGPKKSYLDKLVDSAKDNGSIVCMGLDPVVEAIPEKFTKNDLQIRGFIGFIDSVFNEMKKQDVFPAAFKPNQGFYMKYDNPREDYFVGSNTLSEIMNLVEDYFSGVPIILDFKRGDIAKSSENYAVEGFDCWKADAVTVSPYMGTDSVSSFVKYCNNERGKGVYVLDRTSNSGARDFQDLRLVVDHGVAHDFVCLYKVVAEKIVGWAKNAPGVGAVVGATSLEELSGLAKLYAGKDIPLLIPGVGKKSVGGQGGDASEVVQKLRDSGYDLSLARINVSSGLTHPWKEAKNAPADFAKVCVNELRKLNEEIRYV